MHTLTKVGSTFAALALLAAAFGCSAADTGDTGEVSTETGTQALGQRCTVRGNPPVTSGCGEGESCAVVACTNSFPATCWGTCRAPAPKSKPACEGAFNCLCGTPTCIDGEWTCVGSCGGPAPQAPKPACEGAFNCLCGTAACVDGEWTCIGDCRGPTE